MGPRPDQAQGERPLAQERRTVTKASITVKGKTQAGAGPPQERDQRRHATTVAGKDSLWETKLAIADGSNTITITATDPAGNANTGRLTVRKGSGASTAQPDRHGVPVQGAKLPKNVSFTVGRHGSGRPARRRRHDPVHGDRARPRGHRLVRDPNERERGGDVHHDDPRGRDAGRGLATVLVTTGSGTATDRQVLTIAK